MQFAGLVCTILISSTSLAIAADRKQRAVTDTSLPPAAASSRQPEAAPATRGPQRVDFDDRLLQGQSNRLGAVYLYQRKAPAQPSLLDRRKSFRKEIAHDLLE